MRGLRRLCRESFHGYAVAIDRASDPDSLGPFFAYAGDTTGKVGHRAFFWKHTDARAFRRELAAHGFRARIVPVTVSMDQSVVAPGRLGK